MTNSSIAWLSFRAFVKDVFSCRLLAISHTNCTLRPCRKMPPKTSSTKTAKNVDSSSQPPEEEVDVIQPFSPAENLLFSANQLIQLVEMVRLAVDQAIDSKIDKSIEKALFSYGLPKNESAPPPPAEPTV